MNIVNMLPTQTVEIHKINKVYEIRLFTFNQYIESFYCRKKSEIKKHLIKLNYSLTYDFTICKH